MSCGTRFWFPLRESFFVESGRQNRIQHYIHVFPSRRLYCIVYQQILLSKCCPIFFIVVVLLVLGILFPCEFWLLGSVFRNVIPVAALRASSAALRPADRRPRSSRRHPAGSCAGWSRCRTDGTDGCSPDCPRAG